MRAFPLIFGSACATVLLAPACVLSEHEDGIEVTVSLAHRPAPAGTWPAGITLDEALVTVTGVEIVPCATDARRLGARGRRPGLGTLLGESIAHAHTAGTPTRLGVPAVEDLLAPAAPPRTLGVLHAPPGRYCSVRITLGPADDDALGLAAAPTMLGMSARLAGSIESSCARAETIESSLAAPIEVSADALAATLPLVIDAASLLDGVDASDTENAACAAAANAARSIH
jgi:hypothetical protein